MKWDKACTTVLVGKKASIDGSVMVARNDDTFLPIAPQRVIMRPAVTGRHEELASTQNGFKAPLPENGYRYQATPNVDVAGEGIYDESGFNEKNVAMSATESVYANEKVLAYDPLIPDGMAEDTMQTMVLPFIDSAKDGVRYLGELVAKYGSPEGNGVIFADQDDIWYMEIVTGHHWVASRIPDDAYVVAANQVGQEQIDFNDPDNFMWSEGIREFVAEHHLNPDKTGWNFRHIFGTDTEKDRHYNTPRVWFAQRYLNPEIKQNPESSDLPFICHASRLISLEDVEYIESSHYNETPFDPLGHGSDEDKTRYRAISLNRTQQSHILQIRTNVPAAISAVMWISIGIPAYTPYLPFYANARDTDPSFANTSMTYNVKDAYWMYRTVSMLTESHYSHFIQADTDYLKECREALRRLIETIDRQAQTLSGEALTAYLTEQNHEVVNQMRDKTMAFIGQLVTDGLGMSKLTFNMDVNL